MPVAATALRCSRLLRLPQVTRLKLCTNLYICVFLSHLMPPFTDHLQDTRAFRSLARMQTENGLDSEPTGRITSHLTLVSDWLLLSSDIFWLKWLKRKRKRRKSDTYQMNSRARTLHRPITLAEIFTPTTAGNRSLRICHFKNIYRQNTHTYRRTFR